jgi:hypothetical protein
MVPEQLGTTGQIRQYKPRHAPNPDGYNHDNLYVSLYDRPVASLSAPFRPQMLRPPCGSYRGDVAHRRGLRRPRPRDEPAGPAWVDVRLDARVFRRSATRPFRNRDPSTAQVAEALDTFVNGDPADKIHLLFNMLHNWPAMFVIVSRELRRYDLGTRALVAAEGPPHQ